MAVLKVVPAEWRGDALRDGDGLVGTVLAQSRFETELAASRGSVRSYACLTTWKHLQLQSSKAFKVARSVAAGGLISPCEPLAFAGSRPFIKISQEPPSGVPHRSGDEVVGALADDLPVVLVGIWTVDRPLYGFEFGLSEGRIGS